jgi:hypothetical protein
MIAQERQEITRVRKSFWSGFLLGQRQLLLEGAIPPRGTTGLGPEKSVVDRRETEALLRANLIVEFAAKSKKGSLAPPRDAS